MQDSSNPREAIFIAGSPSLSGADQAAVDILTSMGFTATVIDDGQSQSSDADGKDLIVISQSVSSGQVSSKFTDVPVPLLVWESHLLDDLGMANKYGQVSGEASLHLASSTFICHSTPR